MSYSILITPGGHLRWYADAEALPPLPMAAARSLQEAFKQSSAAGLTRLASQAIEDVLAGSELPPGLVFWRSFAGACFQALCGLGEGGLASGRPLRRRRIARL